MSQAPALAAFGRARLESGVACLATIRPDGSPRLHPVTPLISAGGLFVYMEPTSPKGQDLRRDPRYALHCAVEDIDGGRGEFLAMGSARLVEEAGVRRRVFELALRIGRNPLERYVLFEFWVVEAMSTTYESGHPKRIKWRAG
jgi:hypothetical protein